MMVFHGEDLEFAESLARVVRAGLGATEMSGIQNILESIAREIPAFGCVLWEASPGSTFSPDKREGGFFSLAQWFKNGKTWPQHDIPVDSATGHAIAHDLPSYTVEDIRKDPNCYKSEFLEKHDLTQVCLVPLLFIDRAIGSLNLFRQSQEPPFTEVDAGRLRQMAGLLPALYETVRDEVAYRCSRAVNDMLHEAVRDRSGGPQPQGLRDITQRFCDRVMENLRCFDVSVYLEEEDKREVYVLYGSTLPNRNITTQAYKKGETGPTAAALTYRTPIKILDLRQPKTYPPGFRIGQPNPKYVAYVEKEIASARKSPLSFIATPILAGERLLGVLRCCVPVFGPTYFASREADLLMLLAGQIGHFVSDQRSQREVYRESQAYKVILQSISSITDLAYAELGRQRPDEGGVLDKGLEAIAKALPGDQWIDIGVRTAPGVYSRRKAQGLQERDRPKEVVELPAKWEEELNAGRGVERNRKDLDDPGSSGYTASISAAATGALLAPIRCRDEFWFLEIVNSGPTEFPKHALAIAELLGKQLGIYHDLLTTIVQLKVAQSELQDKIAKEKELSRAHAQSMMDLEHQIRAPLRHARRRVPGLFKLAAPVGNLALTKQLQYVRGNLRRAGTVAGNARLYSRLASGQPIEYCPASWSYDEIQQLLIEAAMDNMLIADEAKGITFGVEAESFAKLPKDGKVKLDKDLLDQAINDLLDNAGKYSDNNTHVKIEANVSKAYFVVAVSNKGLRISAADIPTVKQRGERGAVARLAAGEGSGIGLWIADEIMKAHGGILEIIPTTPERITRIRLLFPIGRS
jgi:signal transduction histidine kinase/GAF domain-containing protein